MKNRYFCAMDHSIPSDFWSRSNCFWKGPIPKRPGLIGQKKSMGNAAHAFEVGRVSTPWNESHEHCDIVDKPHSVTPAKVMRSTHQGLRDYNHSSCAIIQSPGYYLWEISHKGLPGLSRGCKNLRCLALAVPKQHPMPLQT